MTGPSPRRDRASFPASPHRTTPAFLNMSLVLSSMSSGRRRLTIQA
jgi:hypothetical protein